MLAWCCGKYNLTYLFVSASKFCYVKIQCSISVFGFFMQILIIPKETLIAGFKLQGILGIHL